MNTYCTCFSVIKRRRLGPHPQGWRVEALLSDLERNSPCLQETPNSQGGGGSRHMEDRHAKQAANREMWADGPWAHTSPKLMEGAGMKAPTISYCLLGLRVLSLSWIWKEGGLISRDRRWTGPVQCLVLYEMYTCSHACSLTGFQQF